MSLHPYHDASLPVSSRVEDLLGRMTLDEKVGQLQQVSSAKESMAAVQQQVREGRVGSRILAWNAFAGNTEQETVSARAHNEVARVAREESRLGIPVLNGRDVIHGHRTVFPIPLAQAASWDPDLIEQAAAVAAREARSQGVHWTFAPMVDIARDPRWGRAVEGGGEDPFLTSALAAAMVHGFQGRGPGGLADGDRLLACAKHYVGYGAAEGGRDYDTAEITATTLRNVYLPPFKAAIDAGVGTIMSGFHDLDGESASGSRHLLTDILRGELGFDGFVVSDWDSVYNLVNHRLAEDKRGAAALAFGAGVDMEMVSTCYAEHLADLVRAGTLSGAQLDASVRRILAAKFRLGLFENPFVDEQAAGRVLRQADHRALARRLAARGMVLLKNDGPLLPLPPHGSLAVVGPLIEERRSLLGTWTLDGRAEETPTILESIRAAAPHARITAAREAEDIPRLAGRADAIILVVGEHQSRTGENNCVADIVLPPGQDEVIRQVCRLGKPVVVVVCAARPLAITEAARSATAILWAWHGGSETGPALADLLFGNVTPSGKLPASFPLATGQIPVHYNHKSMGKVMPSAGWYADLPPTPLYPFGFGLSYTTFAYGDLRLDRAAVGRDGEVNVSVALTNTGSRAGEEVAQLYVQDCVASITRPVRELKGFQRVALRPGEARRVAFRIGPEHLGFFGRDGAWRVEPGRFQVWIGGDSTASLGASFEVTA